MLLKNSIMYARPTEARSRLILDENQMSGPGVLLLSHSGIFLYCFNTFV